MAARITRAKRRIHESSIRFAIDDRRRSSTHGCRMRSPTIYLLYTVGHAAPDDRAAARTRSRSPETRTASRPDDRESAGLLALLLLTEARQATRLSPSGRLRDAAEADRARLGPPD